LKNKRIKPFYVIVGIGVVVNTLGIDKLGSSYSIDGGTPSVYNGDSHEGPWEAYRSPTLSNGQHTLTVTYLESGSGGLNLDFFVVLTPDDSMVETSLSSTSSTTISGKLATATVSSGALSNSSIFHSGTTSISSASTGFFAATTTSRGTSSSATTSTKPSDPIQLLVIIGPIIGAIAFCGIIYFWLRHRRKQKEPDSWITSTCKPLIIYLMCFC